MPNCRAICDGLIPALVAARTALTCPRVNETFATSVCPLCLDDDCFVTGSSIGFGWAFGGNLPRRFASWTDVVMSRSSSVSVRYLTALGRSLGRIWRCVAVSAGASLAEARFVGGEPSWTIWVEKRSGVAGLVRSRSMRRSCRHPRQQATWIAASASSDKSGGGEHEPKNNPERDYKARGKSAYSCCLSGRGVGGLGLSAAPLQPGYTHRLVVLPGGLGNLGRPTEPHFNGLLQSTIFIV
jgi:hypothetical protein